MGAPRLDEHEHIDRTKEKLRACILFQDADDAVLNFVAPYCESIAYKKGQCIILENEANDSVFFIAHGAVEIVSYLSAENRVQRLALLKSGSHFADFSVLTKSARSGSAYAFEDSELFKIPGAQFLAVLTQFPAVLKGLVHRLATLNQSADAAKDAIPYFLESAIQPSPQVLQIMPVSQWQKLGAIPVSLTAGLLKVAIKDPHNQKLYSYFQTSFPNVEISVHVVGDQQFDSLHAAASKPAGRIASPKKNATPVFDTDLACLRASSLFGSFQEKSLEQLLGHIKRADFKSGDRIVATGSKMNDYLIIAKGTVAMSRSIFGATASAPITILQPGDGIGEAQVLTDTPYTCSLRALEDVSVLTVPKAVVIHLMNTPGFALAMARVLMKRMQMLGHTTVLKYYQSNDAPDFSSLVHLLPPNLVEEEKVLPLALKDGEIVLGIASPDGANCMVKVGRYLLDYRVQFAGLSEEQFKLWHPKYKAAYQTVHSAGRSKSTNADGTVDVPKWVNEILARGYQERASDIHFEPGIDGMTVRYRIDGVLREHNEKLSTEFVTSVVNRMKIQAQMDISVQHAPQDGHLEADIGSNRVMARVSSLPIKHGEKIVLRLVRGRGSVVPLDMIAPDLRTINLLQGVANSKQGLFLVTGPTGSGKTTTLYSLLRSINQVGVNVVSLEDPIEMEIGGVNQVAIQSKRGLDFSAALRSVLRQDPDVIMVGEIRDEESAGIVFEAAITGHMVLSTLHSGSAFDVVPRLQELGVPRGTMAEGLMGVLTQRLVRGICKSCVTERPIKDWEKDLFKKYLNVENPPATLKYGTGCSVCGQTGYHGRLPVFEVWRNNQNMREALRSDASPFDLQTLARKDGFETIFEFGLRMVLSGLTTAEEIRRVLTTD